MHLKQCLAQFKHHISVLKVNHPKPVWLQSQWEQNFRPAFLFHPPLQQQNWTKMKLGLWAGRTLSCGDTHGLLALATAVWHPASDPSLPCCFFCLILPSTHSSHTGLLWAYDLHQTHFCPKASALIWTCFSGFCSAHIFLIRVASSRPLHRKAFLGRRSGSCAKQKACSDQVAEKSLLRPSGTSLLVHWLRLCAPNARGQASIPGQGTRSNIAQPKSSHDLSEEDRSCLLELRPSRAK